jgi:hypothetical protein
MIENMIRRLWLHYFNHDLDSLPEFKGRYGERACTT